MANREMFAEERRREILRILEERGSASVNMISKILNVSPSTMRNDLNFLNRKGLTFRTHGGAISRQKFNPSYQRRLANSPELKLAIAKHAIDLVNSGDVIFVDAGSTTLMFVEELIRVKKFKDILIIELFLLFSKLKTFFNLI